jgi:TP901 family phage tail tape measure protein
MVLAKLGNLEAAQSTEYLTSMMNGFKIEAKDSMDTISKIISLDNAFATSSGEISSALQRSSVSAQQAGVTFEELASMITVISDVSRKAPESIGESLKTVFARYQDILQGGVDEEGQGINNVGKALDRVGISIRDAEGGFRDFSDVLDDLYPKWGSLNEIEQANILKALAGTRQRESLLILLENQAKYEKGLEVQLNSTGKALERYDEYLGGVEASQNKMKASWEELWQKALSGGAVKSVYDLASGFLEVVDAIGGLPTVLTLATSALVAFNWAAIAAFAANPATVWIVAIGAVVLAIGTLISSIDSADEKLIKLNKKSQENASEISSLRDKQKEVSELSDKYSILKKEYELSGIASQEFLDVQNKLKELIPSLGGVYDDYGNFIISSTEDTKSWTQAIKDNIVELVNQDKILKDSAGEIFVGELIKSKKALGNTGSINKFTGKLKSEEFNDQLLASKDAFNQMSQEGKDAVIKALRDGGEEGMELLSLFMLEDAKKMSGDSWIEKFKPEKEEVVNIGRKSGEDLYLGFKQRIGELTSEESILDSLTKKSMSGELGFSDVQEIPEEYLSALTIEGEKLQLNIDKVKQLQLAKAAEAVESAEIALIRQETTQSEVDMLQLYYDQLLAQSQNTFGQFSQTAWQYDELLWSISNDAVAAGYSFLDMEGTALNSAQAIFDYMSQGDAQFNHVVQQIAQATGRSIQEVMGIVNQMVAQSVNNARASVAQIQAMVSGGLSSAIVASVGAGTAPQIANLFPALSSPSSLGSGGGGGSSSSSGETAADRREAKRLAKLKEIEDAIAKARKEATDDLKDQLNLYKDMVDERKKILDSMVEERNYQQDLEENQNNVADIQNQIAELSLDDSDEARAQVLALQEQLATAQQDLANLEYEHGIEQQKTALDTELERVTDLINTAIASIEGINATSLNAFTSQLATILANMGTAVPTFHSGGVVGGQYQSKENEQFAKLLNKEVVLTPEQMSGFMNKTLPNLMQSSPNISSNMKGMEIGTLMSFNITGSMDKSILPNIESLANKVVEKLNNNMLLRGTKRSSNLFSS